MVKNMAMHNGKTVLHYVINLYVYTICIYICIYIYVDICVRVYIYTHIYMHICMHTHIYILVLHILSQVEFQLGTFIRSGL